MVAFVVLVDPAERPLTWAPQVVTQQYCLEQERPSVVFFALVVPVLFFVLAALQEQPA